MKQLLFLLLFPCLCVAQYTGNENQKITLGEQTSADGLVFRGQAFFDTTATSKITRANKQDTSAYILLDTVTNLLWHYKIGSNGWIQAGGTVTSVAALTLGTTGTNLNSSVATSTTNPVITLNVPTASASNRGALSSADWTTFNNKASTAALANYLPLAGGILTGALEINNNALTQDGTRPIITLKRNGTSKLLLGISSEANDIITGDVAGDIDFRTNSQAFNFSVNNGGSIAFKLASNAAATFASSVTATTGIFTNYEGGGTGGASIDNTGQIVRTSSIELKKDITNIKYGLNEILQINPINFNWIDENKFGNENENGFIAEDVMSIIPNVVGSDANGLFMDYTKIIPILTKAIQEQNALIKALEQRLLILENK